MNEFRQIFRKLCNFRVFESQITILLARLQNTIPIYIYKYYNNNTVTTTTTTSTTTIPIVNINSSSSRVNIPWDSGTQIDLCDTQYTTLDSLIISCWYIIPTQILTIRPNIIPLIHSYSIFNHFSFCIDDFHLNTIANTTIKKWMDFDKYS